MSTVTVTYAGDVAGDWWVLTVTASASSIVFSNADDAGEPSLTLTGLTVGNNVVVNGHARTVTVNGSPAPAKVAAGSGWPFLYPGGNDLTVTGGSGTFAHTNLYA